MKIGLIVYSQTGNTLSVAKKIYDKLNSDGYDVNLEEIKAKREKKDSQQFEIVKSPTLDKYDVVILGSYIEAFCLCPVMKSYLNKIESFKNKKVLCFLTQYFPYPWMGGNNGIKKIKSICESKNGEVKDYAVINWSNKKRDEMITNLIDKFVKGIKKN